VRIFSIPLAKIFRRNLRLFFPAAPPESMFKPDKTALHGKVMKL
jgi:hypothetical protein